MDSLILPPFILNLLAIQVAAYVSQEGLFFFYTLQLQIETLGIKNSQGQLFFIDEAQIRTDLALCSCPPGQLLIPRL